MHCTVWVRMARDRDLTGANRANRPVPAVFHAFPHGGVRPSKGPAVANLIHCVGVSLNGSRKVYLCWG
eukprot:12501350-Alexandrium_andersonii.AAC.1